jgi:flagellar biosynthetic protein FliQ
MSPQLALDLVYQALFVAVKMSAPVLITAVIVGILVNIVQTVTSIKDMSLTFVPKLAAAGVVMSISLPWGIQVMTSFFQEMFGMFGQL